MVHGRRKRKTLGRGRRRCRKLWIRSRKRGELGERAPQVQGTRDTGAASAGYSGHGRRRCRKLGRGRRRCRKLGRGRRRCGALGARAPQVRGTRGTGAAGAGHSGHGRRKRGELGARATQTQKTRTRAPQMRDTRTRATQARDARARAPQVRGTRNAGAAGAERDTADLVRKSPFFSHRQARRLFLWPQKMYFPPQGVKNKSCMEDV